jgi:hypothetical protein
LMRRLQPTTPAVQKNGSGQVHECDWKTKLQTRG